MAETARHGGHPKRSGQTRASERPGPGLPLTMFLLLLLSPLPARPRFGSGAVSPPENDTVTLLRLIRTEVAALGKAQADNVFAWDFHIGPADDDTNQDEHVVVLIQELDTGVRMTIQVTELEPSPRDPNIRLGKASRVIACFFRGDGAEISRSDFPGARLRGKLAEILEAILDKKKLLKSGGHPTPGIPFPVPI